MKLTLGFPNEISDGIYASEITDENNGPITVQSSRIFWDRNNTIHLDNAHNRKGIETFYDKVKDIESRVCEQISRNSGSWFGTELEFETVKDSLFNTAIKVPSKFNEPFSMYVEPNSEIVIYDAKKRKRTIDDIVGEATVLLHANRVLLSSMSAHVEWEILQVLVHKKKSIIKLAELSIQEEPEEHVPVELFPKKTKKKVVEEKVVEKVLKPVLEPEELNVEETVKPTVDEPVIDEELETESIEDLEPTPTKFILEDDE